MAGKNKVRRKRARENKADMQEGSDFVLELEQLNDSLKTYTDKLKELGVSL